MCRGARVIRCRFIFSDKNDGLTPISLKTMAISRLMLDNFPHIKAYWVMLGLKTAQVALRSGPTISTAPSCTRGFITTPAPRRRRKPPSLRFAA